jgi:DHA2 family metal-tetracycline-proton antiporter-like MFS transporter
LPISPRVLLAILFGLITIVVANNSAGSLAQPAIGEAFGAGTADVGWVVFGYSGAFAVSTAVWGGLARRLGVGPSISIGILIFSVGSLAAALAPSLPAVIAARIVQGLGSGAIPTLATAIIAARFAAGPVRSRALGTTVSGVATGLAFGPIVGGLALIAVGWQGPLAFGILAAPAALVLYRVLPERDPTARIDLPGVAGVAVAVIAATLSLNRLPVDGLTPVTVGAVVVLVVALVLLGRHARRPDAFVPRRIVAAPAFRTAAVLGAIGMSTFLGSLVLVPVAGARAYDLDGLALGLLLLPMAVTAAIASLQNARIQAWLGRRATTTISLAGLALGAALLGLFGVTTSPAVMALVLTPIGFGFGLLNPPLLNELTSAVEEQDRALAVGTYNLVFFLGGAAGAATATALVQAAAELPIVAGRLVPGYSTVELLFVVLPLVAAAVVWRRIGGRGELHAAA